MRVTTLSEPQKEFTITALPNTRSLPLPRDKNPLKIRIMLRKKTVLVKIFGRRPSDQGALMRVVFEGTFSLDGRRRYQCISSNIIRKIRTTMKR